MSNRVDNSRLLSALLTTRFTYGMESTAFEYPTWYSHNSYPLAKGVTLARPKAASMSALVDLPMTMVRAAPYCVNVVTVPLPVAAQPANAAASTNAAMQRQAGLMIERPVMTVLRQQATSGPRQAHRRP